MLRLPLTIAALLAICCSFARADLTVVEELGGVGPKGQTMTATLKFKGSKLRMDVGKEISLLLSGTKGDLTTLIHQQKMAMPIPASMRDLAGQLAQKQGVNTDGTDSKLTPTGKKETITGFDCEEYAGTIKGQKMSVWVTSEIPEYKEILAQMAAIAPEMQQYGGGLGDKSDLNGFPMRTEVQTADGGKFVSRVVSISRDPIADTEFVVPPGYRTMQIPQMPQIK